jgi:hypothetical protein
LRRHALLFSGQRVLPTILSNDEGFVVLVITDLADCAADALLGK